MLVLPSMGSQGPKSAAFGLLLLNLMLYVSFTVIAGWAINYAIDETANSAFVAPVRMFPIIYPIGNMATGFLVIFSLLAGMVGIATSLTGLHNITQWDPPHLSAAAASSLTAWSLTLLAMGVACKEISIGWTTARLRTLETLAIILSGTQLLCAGAIHASLTAASSSRPLYGGSA